MDDGNIEVYRQRYETWRHLDKLRWQMLQLLVAIGSASAIVIRVAPNAVSGWFWILTGAAVLAIALILGRISEGIRANGSVLKKAGEIVGDTDLPDTSDMNKSLTHWLSLIIGGVGLLLIGKGAIFG